MSVKSFGNLASSFRYRFGGTGTRASINPIPTYSVSPSTSSVNEGSTVTFTVTTKYLSNGTTLYWTLNTVSGTINSSDFSGGATSGSFTITNNSGSVALTLANDVATEGTESFQLQVRTDSTSGTVVATSSTVTINDTSMNVLTATGGNQVFTSGLYKYHVFTSPGSFAVSSAGPGSLDYLVVGGGGAGANNTGGNGSGGGGGGAVTYVPNATITATSYPITISSGNTYFYPTPVVQAPSSSAFGTTAAGGYTSPGGDGGPGGSSGNGNSGGTGNPAGCGGGRSGGGGGGAGGAGTPITPSGPFIAGNGGAGSAVPAFPGPTFTGYMPSPWVTAVGPTGLFAGGGGGGDERNPGGGSGGPGGGGRGGDYSNSGSDAVTNTGSGGGGTGGAGCVISRAGGSGASGIVIIRYLA